MSKRKHQALVDELIEGQATLHTVKRSGSVILKGGDNKRLKLSDGAKLTAAGKYYYQQKGVEWTGGFDAQTPLRRVGAREFVVYRDGSQRVARTLSGGEFKYTRIGKQYFTAWDEHEEYIISIPVRMRGRNRSNRQYERVGHIPHMAISGLASLRVPIHLSEAEKHERLKQQVLAGIDDTNALLVNSE